MPVIHPDDGLTGLLEPGQDLLVLDLEFGVALTEHLLVLLVCLTVIVVLALLINVASRGQISALSAVCEIRLTLQQILANTNKIDNSLRDQCHVLYDAHKRISAVTKGVEKPAR